MQVPPLWTLALLLPTSLASQKVLAGPSQQNPLDLKEFEEYVTSTLLEWHVPGIAIAVVDGENTWAAGYGNATLPTTSEASPIPVTPSTLFYCGSTTKAFTAAALSLLMDDDAGAHPGLTWRTPLASLIRDDFVLSDRYLWAQDHLTLEDALSHRTGFARHDQSLGTRYGPDGHAATVRDFARSLRHLPMVTEPRTTWRYCNLMYLVVSHAVETLTGGRWLGETLRERIWRPLGMNGTYFRLEDAQAAPQHLADGYYWDSAAGGRLVWVPFAGLDEASGAGGIVSNVLDYAKWIGCLLAEGAPLSPAGHAAIKTPRVVQAGAGGGQGYDAPLTYALGWDAGTYKGHRVYAHSGGMVAYGAEVLFLPDVGFGVVTLANTAFTSNVVGNVLAWRLINDRLGVPEAERFDWAVVGKQAMEERLSSSATAIERLYPNRADPSLPPSLPLAAYAGTYSHPAYLDIKIELVVDEDDESSRGGGQRKGQPKQRLRAVRDDFVWPQVYDFHHVSAEFWVVLMDMRDMPNRLLGQEARAEFRVGADGRAERFVFESMEDGPEGAVVFERVS